MLNQIEYIKELIDVASKRKKANLLIKNAKIINVFTESIEIGDIAIYKDRIAGIGNYNDADIIIEASDYFVSPSFIDSHMHIESTKLTPLELAKTILPLGTTSIICDPHEIANVCGIKGIEFLIKLSKNIPLEIYFLASSCVPASEYETNFSKLNSRMLKKLKKYNQLIGLAEVMNYPAVISGEKEILEKILTFKNQIIDGHCPNLKDENLNAYISAGIYSDHECSNINEALEKLSKGMYIMLRHGSAAKDLLNLLPLITDKTKSRILLCTDDKDPDDILNEGHINYSILLLTENKIPLPLAIKLATLNPSIFFGFKQKGAIAPGYFANLLIFKELNNIEYVIKDGKIIYCKNNFQINFFSTEYSQKIPNNLLKKVSNTINFKSLSIENIKVINKGKKIRVIEVKNGSIITDEIIIEPKVEDNFIIPDIERDLLKVIVIERHHKTGQFSIGFIRGFGIKKGAFASSIAHDSHNIVSVGTNDNDILNAIEHLKKIKGGIAISLDNRIIGDLPLIYAGLISNLSFKELYTKYKQLKKILKEEMSCALEDPFMTLSFITLPVIPYLKITDKGLFDVNKFNFVNIYADE